MLPAQVSAFDVDGNGTDELVVGMLCACVVDGDTIEMIDQFNARRGEDVVSCVVPVVRSGEVLELMFYVGGSGEFQFLKREGDAVFRYHRTNRVGDIKLLGWDMLGTTAYLFAGQDRFWRLPLKGDKWSRELAGQYETDLEAIHYTHLEAAAFNAASGGVHLVALDGQSHVVETCVKTL